MALEPCGADDCEIGDGPGVAAEAEDFAARLGGVEAFVAPPAGGAAEASRASKEDPSLSSLSLPAAAVRRTAKSAASGVRFSSEAIAALHRVAQAFICFSTDRALHEAKVEVDKAKKTKGKTNPTARKTLTADHVMKFLAVDVPPVAKKLASLFPELMPPDHKPAAIKLLEQLREQDKAAAPPGGVAAAAAPQQRDGGAALLSAFAANAASQQAVPEGRDDADAADTLPGQPEVVAKPAGEAKRKRGGEGEPAAKKQAKVAAAPAAAPLTQFFGKRPTASADGPGPVATPARAVGQAAAAQDAAGGAAAPDLAGMGDASVWPE